MAVEPGSLKSESTSCSRIIVVAEAKIDFSDHLDYVATLDNVPLAGKWHVRFHYGWSSITAQFEHEAVEVGAFGFSATYTVSLDVFRALDLLANPHDICLFFPRHNGRLWTRSDVLAGLSPYFKTLLSNPVKKSEEDVVIEHKKVTITGTAFSTYRAVLAYIRTGYIAFAPLSSTCPTAGSSKDTRKARETLTPDSAAHELFDEVSVLHEAWRRVVIEYVVANWDAVHATKGWKEVEKRIEEEEVPGAAKIMVQLSRAREKARG
uniref:FGENESH: predicted gene_3.415 protein n=1 Tax=Rhodotorula toruloides TaxID=5286 RepID=A0A0K3CB36_RHOTO